MENSNIPQPEKILYTGKTHTTEGAKGLPEVQMVT